MNQKTSETLKKLLRKYYTDYYRSQLSLSDYKMRVKERENENLAESYYSSKNRIEQISRLINFKFDQSKKILVVGAGTGEEMAQLFRMGCQLYGIEPDESALQILKLRAKMNQLDGSGLKKAVAEKIPFNDNYFDLVYCWQVLEHVQNVEQSIKEMVRVTKSNGYIFIGTPDYRQIAEPHYKIYLPLFLPKWINKLLLKIRGKKTGFFNTLQPVTAKKVRNILRHCPVTMMQVINSYTEKEFKIHDLRRLMFWIQEVWEIEQDQTWLIKKL